MTGAESGAGSAAGLAALRDRARLRRGLGMAVAAGSRRRCPAGSASSDSPVEARIRPGVGAGLRLARPVRSAVSGTPAGLRDVRPGRSRPRARRGRRRPRAPRCGEDHDHEQQVDRHQPGRDGGHREAVAPSSPASPDPTRTARISPVGEGPEGPARSWDGAGARPSGRAPALRSDVRRVSIKGGRPACRTPDRLRRSIPPRFPDGPTGRAGPGPKSSPMGDGRRSSSGVPSPRA